MAEQAYLDQLISTAYVSRKMSGVTSPSADEGMGPTNNTGAFFPVLVPLAAGVVGPAQQLTVQCRVAQQSARARFRAKQDGKDAIVSTLTIFTDHRTDVVERDRLTVDGVTYDTEDMNDPGLMHHHLEFVAKRIT